MCTSDDVGCTNSTLNKCCFNVTMEECNKCNINNISVSVTIVLAVLGSLVAIGLAIMVYRIIQKPVTRAEIRKLYSIDVERDSFINDDMEASLIETSTDTVIVNSNILDHGVLYLKKSGQDYETFDGTCV